MHRRSTTTLAILAACLALRPASGEPASERPPLIDLSDPGEADRWRIVNDGVMGGKSEGHASFDGEALRFSGEIVTDGGGFSSVRRPLERGALAGVDGLTLRVRGDGRGYRLTLRDGTRTPDARGGEVMYAAPLHAPAGNDWHTVTVSFDDLSASFHGEPVDVEPVDPARVHQVGLILADGRDGPFELHLAEVHRAD